MSSFRLPQQILHSIIEPQWLPKPRDERESSLEVLEKQEEEQLERLRKAVLPPAPEPLFGGDNDEQSTGVDSRALLLDQPPVDLKATPQGPSFWEKYRNKAGKSEPEEDDSSFLLTPRATSSTRNSGMTDLSTSSTPRSAFSFGTPMS